MAQNSTKRSVIMGGHKTSISLEDIFWNALRYIAKQRAMTYGEFLQEIEARKNRTDETTNLSSMVRIVVAEHFRDAFGRALASEPGVRQSDGAGVAASV